MKRKHSIRRDHQVYRPVVVLSSYVSNLGDIIYAVDINKPDSSCHFFSRDLSSAIDFVHSNL